MNDLSREELKGRVKSVSSKTFKISGDTKNYVQGKLIKEEFQLFNEKGNFLEDSESDTDKTDDHHIDFKKTYSYDTNGNLDEMILFMNGSFFEKTKFSYDKEGNKIEEFIKGIDSKTIVKNTFDENNNMILTEELNSYLSQKLPTKYKYNEKGFLIEERYGYPSKPKRTTVVYDDRGLLIEYTDYEIREGIQDEIVFKESYKYDIYGRMFQVDTYCNEYGESEYGFDTITSCRVKDLLDENKNWIRRVFSEDRVEIRDIQYYI